MAIVDPAQLPDPDSAKSALENARGNGVEDEHALDTLARVAGTSRVLGRYLARKPASLARLAASRGVTFDEHALLARLREGRAESPLMEAVRDFRNVETARVLLQDLAGTPVRAVATQIADIASTCFEVSVSDALAETPGGPPRDESGQPIPFAVIGMGKLGGRELNYSSDVDVIYTYGTDRGVASDGTTPHEWFARAASRVTRSLAEVTEDGVAFRVDLDLRPEGKRGPPVNSLRSIEIYYESYGATWERAAWLRARAVAGDPLLGATVLASVEPFVYRRWLDYATIDAIHEMKERIDREARAKSAKGAPFDVKLGRGGIRELEFFVQTLQLVNAGKRPEVRAKHTLDALDRLVAASLVKEPERVRIASAWEFLRRLEHRLQVRELAQTHKVPNEADERNVIARTMDLPDSAALDAAIAAHTAVVADVFDGLFREKARAAKAASGPEAALLAEPDLAEDAGLALATSLALFADPSAASEAFARIRRGPGRSRQKEAAFRYLARIAPPLFQELRASPDPDAAVRNLERFLAKIGGRTTLLALLAEHAPTVTLLVRVLGGSDHLANAFIGRPELLDVLVGAGHSKPVRRRPDLREEAAAMVAAVDDHEAKLDAIRRFRTAEMLRVGMADLWGGLEVPSVQRQLSDVADAVVEQGLALASEGAGATPGFVVLGLGRLGGREMAYSSDVDLVFLHDPDATGAGSSEGMSKLAQRFLSAISSPTREGVAYRVDTRLRPSGASGPLVVTANALLRYHRGDARVWERQAWLRARPIAGDRGVWRRVRAALRETLLRDEPGPDAVALEIETMREKLERETAKEVPGKRLNVKSGRGGLVDAEFTAQLLQLVHGRANRFLLTPSTEPALRRALRAGVLDRRTHDALASGYHFLTLLENRLRVVTGRPDDDIADDPASWSALARRCRLAGGDGARLRAEYLAITASVRSAFQSTLSSTRTK